MTQPRGASADRAQRGSATSPVAQRTSTVLVFSHRPEVREAIITAVGRRPAPDVGRVRFVEAAGIAEVLAAADAGQIDLAILDGEAQPTGGMGVSRQLKDEIDDCPPIIVTVRRPRRPLAGDMVAGRRRAGAPAGPADRRRDRRGRAAPRPADADADARPLSTGTDAVADTSTDRQGGQTWPGCSAGCSRAPTSRPTTRPGRWTEMLSGEATAAQLAGFLVALRAKGETADEVAGLAAAMLRHARRVDGARPARGRRRHRGRPGPHRQHLDDGRRRRRRRRACPSSSTATAPPRRPAASADVLEALGVAIDLPPDAVAASVERGRHRVLLRRRCSTPAMRHTGPVPRASSACRPPSTSSGR